MELQVVRASAKSNTEDVVFTEVRDQQNSSSATEKKRKYFIEANTNSVDFNHLQQDCTIPVFSKDNECTVAHQEFIQAVQIAASRFLGNHVMTEPEIRVSHVVKGRTPEAIGKPAKDLLDYEKTIYYERMAFILEVPGITETVNGNELTLTIGGVRAYNHENLYSKKSVEKFKVFIGFKNMVCTNLCVSTDGYADELRASHIGELQQKAFSLFQQYNPSQHVKGMQQLGNYFLSEHQFAQMIGKTKLYHYLPKEQRMALPAFEFTDGHVNTVARDYYQDGSFCREADGAINLWKCYNLFTGANKSSYIDTFLPRTVNAYTFSQGIAKALSGDQEYQWFLN
jgi:hypothetical protein